MKSLIISINIIVVLLLSFYGGGCKSHTHSLNRLRQKENDKRNSFFFRFMEKDSLNDQNENFEPSVENEANTTDTNSSVLIFKEGWLRISSMTLYVRVE